MSYHHCLSKTLATVRCEMSRQYTDDMLNGGLEQLRTTTTDLLKINHPVLLAGMNVAAGPKLAAAVTNAGGLGVIGGLGYTPEMLKEQINELKSYLNDKNAPFGVDLLLPQVGGNARKTKYVAVLLLVLVSHANVRKLLIPGVSCFFLVMTTPRESSTSLLILSLKVELSFLFAPSVCHRNMSSRNCTRAVFST